MISKFEYISEDIKVKDFVAIDFETAKALDPCQVGIAVVRNCQIVQTCTYLIRPIDNLYHHKTIEVHHITPKMTENEMSFPDVWSKIVDIFDNEYIVAHNAKFDISVLKYALDYYGLEYPNIKGYICTCILNNHESLKLACARYRIDLLNHHDGGDDAINCAKLYIAHIEGEVPLSDNQLPSSAFEKEEPFDWKKLSEGHSKICGEVLKKDLTGAEPANPFYDRKVVVSGIFRIDRNELTALLKSMGADLDGSVGARTNFLIAGTEVGYGKLRDALQLQSEGKPIRILYEDDLMSILNGHNYEKYHIDLPTIIRKEKKPSLGKCSWSQLVEKFQRKVDGENIEFCDSELKSEDYRLLDLYYHQQQKIAITKKTVLTNLRQLSEDDEINYHRDILNLFTEGESLSYEDAMARIQSIFDKYSLSFQPKACVVNEVGIEYRLFKVHGIYHWEIIHVPHR